MEIKVTEGQLKVQGSRDEILAGVTYLCFTLINKGVLSKEDFKSIEELAFLDKDEIEKELKKKSDVLSKLEQKLQNLSEEQLNKLVDEIIKEG